MKAVDDALAVLRKGRERSDAVMVAYSDGKDSRAILDMCARTFSRVEAFFMYLVPGLACVEEGLEWARRRYNLKIHQYPHWLLSRLIRQDVYRLNFHTLDGFPEWKVADLYRAAMAESGIRLVATGAKKADSQWRKRNLASTAGYDYLLQPVREWSKTEVLAYLRSQGLPIPPSSNRSATGIDLSTPSLLWLHDTYPEDFRRVCEVFPMAEAVVWRRKWHGVEA